MLVGALVGIVSLIVLVAADAFGVHSGTLDGDVTSVRMTAIVALRAAYVVIGCALFLRLRTLDLPPAWRRVTRAAAVMIALSIVGDIIGALGNLGVLPNIVNAIGGELDVERRLLRLAAMASRAVPLIALLAAFDAHAAPSTDTPRAGAARVLVKYEALLFTIGVSALAPILAASALIHREIAWALPIGADTTVAACIAASIRGYRRRDATMFLSFFAITASMIAGLLMGIYAFGGPLPPPEMLGDYASSSRTLLRDFHIVVLSLGVLALSWRTARRST